MIAKTPQPPYYAVIFSSFSSGNNNGYVETGRSMVESASKQDGFLGFESAHEDLGISVPYWKDLESIKKWKNNPEHAKARESGRNEWYEAFKIRIARVERDYDFEKEE